MAPGVLRQSVIRSRATANMDLNTGITHTIVSLMSDFLVEGTRRIAVSKDGVTFLDERQRKECGADLLSCGQKRRRE